MPSPTVLRLRCAVQNYPWGRDGSDSLVGQFGKQACGDDFELKEDEAYAELWMGTHPNGPACLWDDPSTTLSAYLHDHEELLGAAAKRFPSPASAPTDAHLPFLFKILTCKAALPLQIHPDKKLAEALARDDPEQFKDFNHKPEIGVALTPFQGFIGFRPLDQIAATMRHLTELDTLLPQQLRDAFLSSPSPETLKPLIASLLKLKTEEAKPTIEKLVSRINKQGESALDSGIPSRSKIAHVISKLESQYGGDPGVLASAVFMNLVELAPGEGVYAGADEAHAWLEGQIVELMATSDNVLNVGMTDDEAKNSIDLFTKAVTCTPRSGDSYRLTMADFAKSTSGKTKVYRVPFEEFSLLHVPKEGGETLKPLAGPMVAIVFDGRGKVGALHEELALERGAVLFVGAGTSLSVADGVELYAAFYDE